MKKNKEDLGSQSIGKLLFRQAMPATIGMMVNSLYNLVDSIFVGQGVGALALGGLAISFPLQMIGLALGTAIGIGSASILSRSLGAGDDRRAAQTVGNSFIAVFIVSIIITVLGLLFLTPILRTFGATDGVLPYASDYMVVILSGTFFYIFMVSTNNVVRAEGRAKIAMVSMILGTGLNLILDPIFIFGFGMGIRGAAIATVLSIFVAFIYLLRFYLSGKSSLSLSLADLKLNLPILIETSKIGSSSLMRMLGGSLQLLVLYNSIAYYGQDIHLAIVGATQRIIMFLFLPLVGIVQGLQPILGYNYGAEKMHRVKEALKLATRTSTIYSLAIWAILMLFSDQFLLMFNTDGFFVAEGGAVLRIITLLFPFIGIQLVGSSLFQAIGKAGPALFLNSARQMLFLVPLVLVLPLFFDLSGIWYAYPISDFLATFVTAVWVALEIRKLNEHKGIISKLKENAVLTK